MILMQGPRTMVASVDLCTRPPYDELFADVNCSMLVCTGTSCVLVEELGSDASSCFCLSHPSILAGAWYSPWPTT